MEFKKHDIRVEIVPDGSAATYHAVYTIYRYGLKDLVCSGTIAGGLHSPAEAELEAFAAARRWIERQARV